MPTARTISALILVGSLVGCSSNGLPTQRAYNVANLEQPQAVSFHCGALVAAAPAILPNPLPPGIGIRPGVSRWLLGLHAGARGPNAGIQLSAGFLDLYGIASNPEEPLIEYTVVLNSPPNPAGDAVIVVQSALPALYPNVAPGRVVVRVVGSSGRVMPYDPAVPCAQTPLQISPQTQVVAYPPADVTHSFLGAGGVVYMNYPSRGITAGF
jgi:hypothetical protein